MSIPIGLGIGRLVFRALNLAEAALCVTVIAAIAVGGVPAGPSAATIAVAGLLLIRLAVIRPRLNRRSDRIPAGEQLPR